MATRNTSRTRSHDEIQDGRKGATSSVACERNLRLPMLPGGDLDRPSLSLKGDREEGGSRARPKIRWCGRNRGSSSAAAASDLLHSMCAVCSSSSSGSCSGSPSTAHSTTTTDPPSSSPPPRGGARAPDPPPPASWAWAQARPSRLLQHRAAGMRRP